MVDYFLKIDGIAGESQDVRHQGEIEVESFSWGESFLASAAGTGGAGKVHFQDLQVVKRVDTASPLLMLAAASGRHFTSAVLTAQRPGPQPQDYLTITFSDLTVSSYQIEAQAGQLSPVDMLSFTFSRIEIAYRQQRPDGTFDPPVDAGWDAMANRTT